ncbi:MAG: hypothetical protein NW214_12710 [Pseudanabaenaceae cyanobacterium bins.39]|nr:hypothetical protein [Pseudanabaenaceae cyanobacterium bins.39]
MSEQKKAVLMMHTDQDQGQLWQTALETQQMSVVWEQPSVDLVKSLTGADLSQLPDLLIIDMAIKSPNSETLQSSSICQWVAKTKANIKVVLFNPRQDKIKDIEHSWALRRGAADVLPRLSQENLIAGVARVTALIGCTLIAEPLESIANSLSQASQQAQISPAEDTVVTRSRSTTKNNSKNAANSSDTSDDSSNVVMYRGVRIRK